VVAHGYRIVIEDCGREYRCAAGQTALRGMEALGGRGIPVGCRQGGCGVCKVQVLSGTFSTRVMSRAQVSEEDEREQRVLACCIYPTSDLRLKVIGAMTRCVERLASDAAERADAQVTEPAGAAPGG
jgi:ferredoxin